MEDIFLIAKALIISQLAWKALHGNYTMLCVKVFLNGELSLFTGVLIYRIKLYNPKLGYKAGMHYSAFGARLGARGIAPLNLHPVGQKLDTDRG